MCMLGAGVNTCFAIYVHRLCCLDVYRAQTKSAHLLRGVQIRSKPRCMAVSSPSIISYVVCLRIGVTFASVLARTCLAVESPLEEGCRWSLQMGG